MHSSPGCVRFISLGNGCSVLPKGFDISLTLNEALASIGSLSHAERLAIRTAAANGGRPSLRSWAGYADGDNVRVLTVAENGEVRSIRGEIKNVTYDDFEVGGYAFFNDYKTLFSDCQTYVGESCGFFPGGQYGVIEVREYIIILPC